MNFCRLTFNLYLLLPVLSLAVSGCAGSMFHHKKEPTALLRVHVESESSAQGSTQSVPVLRSQPVSVNISKDPILTEVDLIRARLLNSQGGFVIELKFEETAGWRLEQYTAINPGKHLVIYAHWGDKPEDGRWLGAPQITRRVANSTITFTPDASHDEAEELVKELNAGAKKNAGGKTSD
jgi:preprotein translocase subunit SecD